MKRLILCAVVALFAGIATVWLIDRRINLEVEFFYDLSKVTDKWASTLREKGGRCFIVSGGSEIKTTIDPEKLEELHGINVINAGNHAGFGPACNAATGFQYVREGDTFILSTLCGTKVEDVPVLGAKYALRRLGLKLYHNGVLPRDARVVTKALAGDSVMMAFYAYMYKWGRVADRHAYANPPIAEIHRSGLLEILAARELELNNGETRAEDTDKLKEYISLCERIKEECLRKKVDFMVLIPVRYAGEELRIRNAQMALQLTRAGIPVLKDSRLGAMSDKDYFADTPFHLSRKGIDDTTRMLGPVIKNKVCWSETELNEIVQMASAK